jgi:hypothetical protein
VWLDEPDGEYRWSLPTVRRSRPSPLLRRRRSLPHLITGARGRRRRPPVALAA